MITRLVIENYKSIKSVDIELNSINILIGSNGAGKSNFISFFKLLNSITRKRLQYFVDEESGANNILFHGLKESDHIYSRIELKNKDDSTYYKFTLNPNTDEGLFFSEEYLGYRDDKNYKKYYDYSVNLAHGLESNLDKNEEMTKRVRSIIRNRLNKYKVYHFQDTSRTAKVKQSFNIFDNETLYDDARNLASFLYKLKETNMISLKKIEKTIQLIAPYFDSFILKPDFKNNEQIKLFWREKNSDMLFNASHLSDGTLRMICLITLFLQPSPPETIILDEPELGLHPFALTILSDLIKSISKKGVQVIISTQSIPLVDKFELNDIIVVEKNGKASTFNRLNIDDFENWINEYSIGELWEKNLLGGRP